VSNTESVFAVRVNHSAYQLSENGTLTISNLPEGSHEINISVEDNTVVDQNIYTLVGKIHTFKLKELNNTWKLSIYAEESLPDVALITPPDSLLVSTTSDTVTAPAILTFSDSIVGCNTLTNLAKFEQFQAHMQSIIFESKLIKTLNDSLPNYCLTTQQFSTLLAALDFEENKVALIKTHFRQIFDITLLSQLKEELILQSSIDKFNIFLQSAPYQQFIKKQ
jgi:hypothetical protein